MDKFLLNWLETSLFTFEGNIKEISTGRDHFRERERDATYLPRILIFHGNSKTIRTCKKQVFFYI